MARGVEQPLLGDVRGPHVLEAGLDVGGPDVVLHLALDHAALGVEDRQAGAQFLGEAEQVELGAQLAVVAAGGLGEPVLVGGQVVPGRPGGAVEPLQLLVGLVAAPVRRRAAGQGEGLEVAGVRHVRAAAQVLPGHAAVPADVVVDRQLPRADLDRRALGGVVVALQPDQLQLVRLVGEFGPGLLVGDRPPDEALALLDDPVHALGDRLEVLGGERGGDVEVVVEAVGDRRADAELGVGEQQLDGLRGDVRAGVPDDVQPVGAVDLDRLQFVAVGELTGQVDQDAVTAHRDDPLVVAEQVEPGSARLNHPLLARLGTHHGEVDGHGLFLSKLGPGDPRGPKTIVPHRASPPARAAPKGRTQTLPVRPTATWGPRTGTGRRVLRAPGRWWPGRPG